MTRTVLNSLEVLYPRSLSRLSRSLTKLVEGKLWLQILIAMAIGIGVGIAVNEESGFFSAKTAHAIGEWLALPGHFFLGLIQMIVVPLILASIVRGITAASDVQQLKSTGIGLGIYFLATTILAVTIGIVLGLSLQPGRYVGPSAVEQTAEAEALQERAEAEASNSEPFRIGRLPRQLTEILPKNPLSAVVEGEMLQIVIFGIILGIGMLLLPLDSARPLLELFGSIQQVCMAIVGAVMRIAPLAVFGLLAQAMIKTGPQVLLSLGIYAAVVILGMACLLVCYTAIARVLGAQPIGQFLAAIRKPLLLGFSTNSSAATMPVTVETAEVDLKVRPSIAQFVVPLGATVNMGGTALYQGLATVFMAQMFQIDLPLSALVALVATAVGASIGTPAVPGVGIIVLASVLTSAGVPLSGLALIVGIDRILERFRTSLNVAGDLTACTVMDRLIGSPQDRDAERDRTQRAEAQRNATGHDIIMEPSAQPS